MTHSYTIRRYNKNGRTLEIKIQNRDYQEMIKHEHIALFSALDHVLECFGWEHD